MNARRIWTLAAMLLVLVSVHPASSSSAGEPLPTLGTITVHKFKDLDQDGVQDSDEADLANWPMRVYRWDEGQSSVLIAEGKTDDLGRATFTDLEPGRYKAWEAGQECWEPTTPGSSWDDGHYRVVHLAEGESAAIEFGNVYACGAPPPEAGIITAHKFQDRDGDGVQDDGEEGVKGWTFRLYLLDGDIRLFAEGATDPDGSVVFAEVPPGLYKVWEELPGCWEPTTPGRHWNDGYYRVIDLDPGEQLAVEFGNVETCGPPPEPETCVDLEKTGPLTAYLSQTVTYHFWARNCGEVALNEGTQIYDPLFGDGPVWSGNLEPEEVVEFDMPYVLPDDYCGEFTNDAWIVGNPPGHPEVRDDSSWIVKVDCGLPPATLILEPDQAQNQLPLESSHPFTATVLDQYGASVVGVPVSFSTDFGRLEEDGQYVKVPTDESGRATVTVDSAMDGIAHIRAWIDDGGDEYDEGELTDQVSTKVWMDGRTTLEVWKTAEVLWTRAYDWTIGKSVRPDSLSLLEGQSADVTYTIAAERDLVSDTHTAQGTIYAENDVESTALVKNVVDCIEYCDPATLDHEQENCTILNCETLQTDGTIDRGEVVSWTYGIDFTPVVSDVEYFSRVDVAIYNHPDGVYTFTHSISLTLPSQPASEEDACAEVIDVEIIPDGFQVEDDYPGGWRVCDSDAFTIIKTLTDTTAGEGAYYLINTATLTEVDSLEQSSDEAEVTISITPPRPCLRIRKILEGAFTNPLTGDGVPDPVPHIRLGAEKKTRFHLRVEVENCGSVNLADVRVDDVIGYWVAPRAVLEWSAGDAPDLRPSNVDEPGLDTIVWIIGDLPTGQAAYLKLRVNTLPALDDGYAPTSLDQVIEINTGAAVSAEMSGLDAVTKGITLTMEPTDAPDIGLITPTLPYTTPWEVDIGDTW